MATAAKSIALFYTLGVCLMIQISVAGQDKSKPWTEWSRKESEKLLNSSPWGQTQVETDSSELTYRPTAPGSNDSDRNSNGARNQAIAVNYRVRLLSARPIREAFCRMIVLSQEKPNDGLAQQLQSFIDRDFGPYIVVSVMFDATDGRMSGPVMQAFNSATTETLKNNTYLERKDGKKVFLNEYRPAGNDGLGAKFVFLRSHNDTPFLSADSGTFRFFSEFNSKVKINVRFKLSEMEYQGKVEY